MIALDWRRFDEKYGRGSNRQLLEELADPCIPYLQIAREFGVTDRAVQFWREALSLDMDGFERRRLRAQKSREPRRMEMFLDDFVARTFYGFVETHCPDAQVELIDSKGQKTLLVKTREVKLDGRVVWLSRAWRRPVRNGENGSESYAIRIPQNSIDFLFYLLRHGNFLFVPRYVFPQYVLPRYMTTYTNTEHSRYFRYRNNFDALRNQREGYNGNRPQSSSA